MNWTKVAAIIAVMIVLSMVMQGSARKIQWNAVGKKCDATNRRSVCGDDLICNTTGVCSYCKTNEDCLQQHSNYHCREKFIGLNQKTPVKLCSHKSLFSRISIWDALATASTFVGSVLASGGGIGGGGIFVPLLNTVGQFSASIAIPLSKAMIFGAAICNYLMYLQRRHPYADKPIIDYDAALILEPFTLLGTIIGVFLNVMFPEWLIVTLLCILLTATTIRTTYKGIKLFQKETLERKYSKQMNDRSTSLMEYTEQNSSEEEEEGELDNGAADIPIDADISTTEINERAQNKRILQGIVDAEKSLPIAKLLVILTCWIIIFTISLFKGGHGYPSIIGIQSCGVWYWVIVASAFPIITFIGIGIAAYLVAMHRTKVKVNYTYHHSDIKWTVKNAFLFPGFCLIAGIAAGLLGIGGGMVKGPILLELGLEAEVVAATSAFMILFTSSITTAQYLIIGRLPLDYGLWFAVNGFISALVGQLISDYLVKKYKRGSIIIFIIALVIGISTIFMTGIGIWKVVVNIKDGFYMGFHPPC